MRYLRTTASSIFLLSLAGCGGGSDGPAPPPLPPPPPPPPAANNPPVFNSPATITVEENATGVIYTFDISDPEGDAVTLDIIEQGDGSLFGFDQAARTLSVDTPLDFESPADGNGDNVYEIQVSAVDTVGGETSFDLEITVTDAEEEGALEQVASGFAQPLFAAPIPGTGQLAVVEKGGLIRVVDPATGTIAGVNFLDVSGEVSTNGERGLLGLAFSPDFEADRTFYVNLTNTGGATEIRRYQTFSGSLTQADPASEDLVFTTPQPAANHNAGWIGFSNDGLLYIPLGDGGGGGDPNENAQDVSEVLGKILRVDVTGDDFPADDARDYAIPPGNPFASGGGRPEIFAIGLRNPFRASVDPVTGDLFIGDVGQGAVEEIDRLAPDDAGVNFGWDTQEGTQDFEGADSPDFTDPVAEYGHGSGPLEGNSVTGGYVYRGPVGAIHGHYVFGDFVSGNYWSVPVDELVNGATVPSSEFQRLNDLFPPDTGSISNISSFGLDADGNLLIVEYGGSLYRLGLSE